MILIYANALFILSPTLLPLIQLTQFILPILAVILFAGQRRRLGREDVALLPQRAA